MKRVLLVIFSFFLFVTTPVHASIGETIRNTVGGILDIATDGDSPSGLVERLIEDVKQKLKEELSGAMDELKMYVEGGIRKVGDTIAERIMENERVKSIIRIVKITCWIIISYLVLVTFLLFFFLRKIYNKNMLILKLLEEMKEREARGNAIPES